MEITAIPRIFRYDGTDLPDPSPILTGPEVLAHYSTIYPEMVNAKISKTFHQDDKLIHEISTKLGQHG